MRPKGGGGVSLNEKQATEGGVGVVLQRNMKFTSFFFFFLSFFLSLFFLLCSAYKPAYKVLLVELAPHAAIGASLTGYSVRQAWLDHVCSFE